MADDLPRPTSGRDLYERCDRCGESPSASCPVCGGQGFVRAGIAVDQVDELLATRDRLRERLKIVVALD